MNRYYVVIWNGWPAAETCRELKRDATRAAAEVFGRPWDELRDSRGMRCARVELREVSPKRERSERCETPCS